MGLERLIMQQNAAISGTEKRWATWQTHVIARTPNRVTCWVFCLLPNPKAKLTSQCSTCRNPFVPISSLRQTRDGTRQRDRSTHGVIKKTLSGGVKPANRVEKPPESWAHAREGQVLRRAQREVFFSQQPKICFWWDSNSGPAGSTTLPGPASHLDRPAFR